MTVRKMEQNPRLPNMGSMQNGRKGKLTKIKTLLVYPSDKGHRDVVIEVEDDLRTFMLTLGADAAMELCKGLLANQADVTLDADEEFKAIVTGKIAASQADAQAMVDAVLSRGK